MPNFVRFFKKLLIIRTVTTSSFYLFLLLFSSFLSSRKHRATLPTPITTTTIASFLLRLQKDLLIIPILSFGLFLLSSYFARIFQNIIRLAKLFSTLLSNLPFSLSRFASSSPNQDRILCHVRQI